MHQNTSMYSFIQIFTNFCIFFFTLLVQKTCAAHYQYEACAPRACGGLHIKFPFYIRGLQESYCGLPEFELNCSNSGSPAIHIPENNYVIDAIFYEIQTFRLHNTVASSISNCIPEIGNITLNDRFDSVNASNIHLLTSCKNNSLPEVLRKYRTVACDENRKDGWGLAMLEGDENLNKALEECEKNVLAPVEVHGDGGGPGSNGILDYEGLLRRGFELNWKGSSCRRCERSGGHCGFDENDYHFWCFCPDRPHRLSCKSGKNHWKLILAIVIPGCASIFIVLALYLIWRRKKGINAGSYFLSRNTSEPSSKPDLEGGSVYFGVPVFSYCELEEATNNFDVSKELGDGGFGTVYFGKEL